MSDIIRVKRKLSTGLPLLSSLKLGEAALNIVDNTITYRKNNTELVTFYAGQNSGPKGDKGDKGDIGNDGVQGVQGERGLQGIQGIQGIQGEKGDKGDQGIQGIKGDAGERGIQGIQGLKGDKGDNGEQGIKGDDGYTPQKGIDYFDGTDAPSYTQLRLNTGRTAFYSKTLNIENSICTSNSIVDVFMQLKSDSENELELDNVGFSTISKNGSFDLIVSSPNNQKISGIFDLKYKIY